MEDSIYELYTGDYIDLRNLIAVHKVEFDVTHSFMFEDKLLKSGLFFIACRFRFIKESVMFYDSKEFDNYDINNSEEKLEDRSKFIKGERQKLIKAWKESRI